MADPRTPPALPALPALSALPAEVASFVGRRREVAEVRRTLGTARLVTLVGPGGVGKTRLAVRVAHGETRSVWLVELADVRDPGLVGHAVLAALGLRDQSGADPGPLLRAYLRDKRALLVLDNCEHLLDAAAVLAGELLRTCPYVRVLATSREPLGVTGEHVLPVRPLDADGDAVRLFAERAGAAGGFVLTDENRAVVVDICRRLDGLPLAVELAAVRTRVLGPEQIRERLDDRFALLTGGGRAALPRHRTLRTAIEWSHDLLSPGERDRFARLCVFAGRFTLDDVSAVGGPDRALDELSSLVDKSLVVRDEAAGVAAYRLHETMREFARTRLPPAEHEAVESRCADYYLSRCRELAAAGRHRLLDSLAWVDLEIDNIRGVLRAAFDREDYVRATGLATSLIWYWVTRATGEGVRWLDQALAGPVAHPWTYYARGFLGVLRNDPSSSAVALGHGVSLARSSGPVDALVQNLAMASIAATMLGDRDSAGRLLGEARDLAAGLSGDSPAGLSRDAVGGPSRDAAGGPSRDAAGGPSRDAAVGPSRDAVGGPSRDVAGGLDAVGARLITYQALALNGLIDGELGVAAGAAAEGVRLSRAAGDLYSLAMMLMNRGYAALRSGSSGDAGEWLAEGLRIAHRIDDRVAQCYLVGGLGACAAPRRAAELLGATESLRAELGATVHPGMAPALTAAARAAEAALGPATYRSAYRAGLRLSRDEAVRLALNDAPAEPPVVSASVLGRREADVALLVTEGLRNKEIGARLFISERTVESHVRSILAKLGFTSRAQIAGWMSAQEAQDRQP